MRTLLLYRHAKSSWDDWSLDDFDRPLSGRGQKAAPLMGQYILDMDLVPETILCSPSLRTRQTLDLTCPTVQAASPPKAGHSPETGFPRELYHGQDMTLLNMARKTADGHSSLCLVGHNPGIHSLAGYLASCSARNRDREHLERKFPTAALAVFQVNAGSWLELAPATCKLLHFMTPKLLKKAGKQKS